jgi:hypothetical protein
LTSDVHHDNSMLVVTTGSSYYHKGKAVDQ